MAETTTHLKVVEVDSAESADVTLEGEETQIEELCESADLDTLLQTTLGKWEKEVDGIDVEVKPRKGFAGTAAKHGE